MWGTGKADEELLRHLRQRGCELWREGKKHSVYWNPANRKTASVPRHTKVKVIDKLARKIREDLGIPGP